MLAKQLITKFYERTCINSDCMLFVINMLKIGYIYNASATTTISLMEEIGVAICWRQIKPHSSATSVGFE